MIRAGRKGLIKLFIIFVFKLYKSIRMHYSAIYLVAFVFGYNYRLFEFQIV
jgi:hypothetical protein